MSLALNYPQFQNNMKTLFKNRNLDEDEWTEALCQIIQTHLLSAGVSTIVTGTAGTVPVTGTGTGELS